MIKTKQEIIDNLNAAFNEVKEKGYCTSEAPGAPIPKGEIIEKCNSEPGDAHNNGDSGKVVGSIGPIMDEGQLAYGYFVDFYNFGQPVFVNGNKIRKV